MVLIRPRPGDFVYSPAELAIMQADIELCRELGSGAVITDRPGYLLELLGG